MKSISTLVSIILMLLILIGLITPFIGFLFGFFGRQVSVVLSSISEPYCSGVTITFYVRNDGKETSGRLFWENYPENPSPIIAYNFNPTTLPPGSQSVVTCTRQSGGAGTWKVKVFAEGATPITLSAYCSNGAENFFIVSPENRNLTFVAYSTPHWVTFDYITGKYMIFYSSDGDLTAEQGPYTGDALILEGIDSYTISLSWVPWDQRPIDTPIVIVKNSNPSQDWIFNWTDPGGSFLFHLQPIPQASLDFLVFWEDLFNPFNPPSSIDDWKDHVVRITLIPPNTYRIAVYLAKGGYKHQFFILTTNPNPLQGVMVYEKPYGAWWSNKVGDYYEEYKVYIHQVL